MGWGNVLKNRLEYAVGIFDGPRNSYQDFNNAKDVMAFMDFRPFFQTETALKTLSVGGSVHAGKENNPLVPALLRGSVNASGNTLATGSGDSLVAVPFLAFNNNVRERGDRKLWELHATYFYKGLSVLGAWDGGIDSYALTTPNALPVPLPVSGFHVQVGYILTGETLEKRALVDPLHPFDLRKGKFGLGALDSRPATANSRSAGRSSPAAWPTRTSGRTGPTSLTRASTGISTRMSSSISTGSTRCSPSRCFFAPGRACRRRATSSGSASSCTIDAPSPPSPAASWPGSSSGSSTLMIDQDEKGFTTKARTTQRRGPPRWSSRQFCDPAGESPVVLIARSNT